MENRAGEEKNAGSFAWLESKEADRSFFSPLPFKQRGGTANHTHCWKTTGERGEEKGEQREEQRTADGKTEGFEEESTRACLTSLLISNTPS